MNHLAPQALRGKAQVSRSPDQAIFNKRAAFAAGITSIYQKSVVDVPEDFDPRENPIIARHFFNINPDSRPIADVRGAGWTS